MTKFDVAIAAWIVIASVLAVFMTRRGHRPTRWLALAFLLGPLALPIAAWARYQTRGVRPTVLQSGHQRIGALAVLVGVDGSANSNSALVGAVDTLADRIGRLTLACVVDFESLSEGSDSPERLDAEDTLREAAAMIEQRAGLRPRTVLLAGSPADALVEHAQINGDDLLVIGAHGRGESDWPLGSVAADLTRQKPVRVMIITGG